jgi:hypothetical protein
MTDLRAPPWLLLLSLVIDSSHIEVTRTTWKTTTLRITLPAEGERAS